MPYTPALSANDNGEDRAQRAVQSVEVGGRLLLALADSPGPLGLKDLSARAGLTPSRAHPYLVSYGRLGLVEQDVASGRYALGPAALRIGLACLHQFDPLQAAEPVARELAARTGHAVALAVWGNFGPTVVRLIEARQPLHVAIRVGSVMSPFDTATGRAFAAAMPRERLAHAVAGPLGELAPRRLVEHEAELAQIEQDYRRHGLARAVGRPIPGVNAFSAAAFDHEGTAAIVITALDHQDRFNSAWNGPDAQAVREAAAAITHRLGGPGQRA
ncbi:IclR family transcriptional regulator [uncultured Piscinibacter sp.]|uniref:IclR family transcriptional regulator n=1 Tax=uncultured Piscinibacter sp. TaxID=1131835 RepID=UPI00260FCA79|nr:IclR family transcriptional regulator [uncultured Piscinibacter sp.]